MRSRSKTALSLCLFIIVTSLVTWTALTPSSIEDHSSFQHFSPKRPASNTPSNIASSVVQRPEFFLRDEKESHFEKRRSPTLKWSSIDSRPHSSPSTPKKSNTNSKVEMGTSPVHSLSPPVVSLHREGSLLHECSTPVSYENTPLPQHALLHFDVVAQKQTEEKIATLLDEMAHGGKKSNGKKHQPFPYREHINKIRREFAASTLKLENSTLPSFPIELKSRDIAPHFPSDSVLYVVVTGNNSYATRVAGIQNTLGKMRRVIWFSDTDHPELHPFILQSSFESEVCTQKGLVMESQGKGCHYQRQFYTMMMMWSMLGDMFHFGGSDAEKKKRASSQHHHQEGEEDELVDNFASIRWIVRLSDDTLIIPTNLEMQLSQLKLNPLETSMILGRNESRLGYWFYSGGHPVVMSIRALQELMQQKTMQNCESTVMDFGGETLKKFWWWADDVLSSFCFQKMNTAQSTRVLLGELKGTFSAPTFADLHFPTVLDGPPEESMIVNERRVINPNFQTGKKSTSRKNQQFLCINKSEIPVSYHVYPYITPYQMYGLYNRLYVHRNHPK